MQFFYVFINLTKILLTTIFKILQHQIEDKDISIEDLLEENGGCDEANIPCNLLTVVATGSSCLLEELLKAGMDPDIGDSRGRTPLVQFLLFFNNDLVACSITTIFRDSCYI